tara:strand:+ start:1343 stop:2059 length:717 start_codon:yes stop_codon:yes gene_type:complete
MANLNIKIQKGSPLRISNKEKEYLKQTENTFDSISKCDNARSLIAKIKCNYDKLAEESGRKARGHFVEALRLSLSGDCICSDLISKSLDDETVKFIDSYINSFVLILNEGDGLGTIEAQLMRGIRNILTKIDENKMNEDKFLYINEKTFRGRRLVFSKELFNEKEKDDVSLKVTLGIDDKFLTVKQFKTKFQLNQIGSYLYYSVELVLMFLFIGGVDKDTSAKAMRIQARLKPEVMVG